MLFNPLNYPICFDKPRRLTDITSWHEHIPFAFTIVQMLKPKIFVELGTHKGDSYCAFCQAVSTLGLDTACYAVDTWEGDEHAGFYGSDILAELKTYHDSKYKGFSQLIQTRFEEALDYFSDGSIDLIHIDGCHTYDAVKHDFEAWLPKMSQRGVVLIHDINVHEREFGVWKFWGEVTERHPSFEFKHGHGLGVLAVGTEVPKEVLAFLNMGEQEVVATTRLYSYLGDKIALGHQLQSKDVQITELTSAMQAKDAELTSALQTKDAQIAELSNTLQTMQQSIVWQLLQKFHYGFIERALPYGTARSRLYQKGLIGIRILFNEGWESFWWKYNEYKRFKNSYKNKVTVSKLDIQPISSFEDIDEIDGIISIVIPTKNAGPDFEFTLEKICQQKGIKEIEIIIVDSGSTDETVKLAEKFKSKIYCIRPEEFNHGGTRNYGAEKASGNYILFMTQDAIPIGEYLFYNMVKIVEKDSQIAAVTCRQVPRSDADLFAGFSLWYHYRMLDFTEDRISSLNQELNDLSPLEKIKLAGLENVCCLIKKGIFNDLKFKNIQYAEDLDMGLRILENGFKIAFLYSNGVIHSHNRTPLYFFKRSYVDNKELSKILHYEPNFYRDCEINEIFSNIIMLYAALNASIESLKSLSFEDNPKEIILTLGSLIQKNMKRNTSELLKFEIGNDSLKNIFDEMQEIIGPIELKSNDLIIQHYLNLLNNFNFFIENKSLSSKKNEFVDLLYKLFAITAGSAISNYYLFKSKNGANDKKLSIIDSILSKGT